MLVIGHFDVAVLDRVQISNCFNDGRFDDYNLYDGVTRYGTKSTDGVVQFFGTDEESKIQQADAMEADPSLVEYNTTQPGSGLANLTTGVRGLMMYEAIEDKLKEILPSVYDRLKAEKLRSLDTQPTVGSWHWESWVARSGQEASHKTLDALLAEVRGESNAFANVPSKEGEYGGFAYNTEYARDSNNKPYMTYPNSAGKRYKMSLSEYKAFMADMKKKGANAVTPAAFKVTQDPNGNDRTAPWYEDRRVNRELIDRYLVKHGHPFTAPKLSYAPRKVTAVFGGRTIPAQWSSPASNRMLKFVYDYQDKFIDLKQIMGEVNKINGQISDDMNAYMKEELFHGKVAKQTLDFNKRELAPLLKEMQSLGLTDEEVQEYLWYRHAKERNDKIASINPNFSDMGSGVATLVAERYLKALSVSQKAKLNRVAARVDKIVKETKDLMEKEGLITPEIRKQWDNQYQHYVPLEREEKDYEGAGMGMGQGFSVTPSVKRALGSILPVENILANVIATRERTIVRAEKNRVAKALFSLAVKAPNPNFWIAVTPSALKAGSKVIGELQRFGFNLNDIQNIAAEPMQRYTSDSGFVEERINSNLRNKDNVLHLMIDGREHLVMFNNRDPVAQRLAKALKNIDAGTMGIAMSSAAAVTRWFAAINTQYNPIFGIINLLRDQSTAMFNLSTTPIAGMQKQVYGNSFAAMKGIWEQLRAEQRGQSATSQWGKLFEEFEKEGGPTGYRDMFASSKDRADAIASEFEKLKEGKLKKGGRAIFEMLSNYNTALENGVRLSAYKAALDKGLSKQKAASIAKNLTVNFNRKGDVTMQMNALYAFFNASVQGSARLIETLRGPAGRRIIYGGLTLGMLQSVALIAAGFDDEEPPEFIKERNIIIPTGGGKYITIPMPLGFNVIPNAGRVITDLVLRKNVNVPKKLSSLMLTTIGAFNPVGGGTLSQVLAPTVVDPIIALAENKDNFGRPIYKTDVSGLRPTPGYLRTKETATPWNKAITKFLNYATGGTEFKQGAFSPTPDQLDYLVGVVFGGLGREISKGAQSVGAAISGEELPTYKIPLVSRFYGNTNEAASVASKFYENIKNLNEHAAEIKGRRESRQDVGEYVKDNPEARLSPMATGIYNIINNLNKQKKMALERGLPRERIKQIETQMQMQMKRLNDRVREVRQ
jgi:hypothetical protein